MRLSPYLLSCVWAVTAGGAAYLLVRPAAGTLVLASMMFILNVVDGVLKER